MLTAIMWLAQEMEGTPEANPASPSVSNPAHIPPVGYLQFEQGFLQAGISPGLNAQFGLNQVTRLSVHPRLMLQFATQPIAISSSSVGRSGDAGDLQVGAQVAVMQESGRSPCVAVGYLRKVRSGTAPDLDIGGFLQSGSLLASGNLGQFHYDSNLVLSEQSSGRVTRAQYGQTLSVTHDVVWPKLEITGELWHFTQPFIGTRSHAAGMLWAGGYELRPNLVLDGGVDRGLTSTSTRWEGFAGFTYLLPQRLWAVRAPLPPATSTPKIRRHKHKR